MYVPLSAETARRKVELLHKCYPSQRGRDWWDDEVFLGLARLRGMECRAPYAEAFSCAKSLIVPAAPAGRTRVGIAGLCHPAQPVVAADSGNPEEPRGRDGPVP